MSLTRVAVAAVSALALLGAAAVPAAAEDPAKERPFGSEPQPRLHRVELDAPRPPRFALGPAEALRVAASTEVVVDELAENPATPQVFRRGYDDWQVSFFVGEGGGRTEVAEVIVDGSSGDVREAWRDHQVEVKLSRGYEGAVGGKTTAIWVWLPLCLVFFFAFFDRAQPLRLLHFDLLALLGFSVSIFFFNRGEIVASVPLVYPFLVYLFVRLLIAGLWPRTRPGPLVPKLPIRFLAVVTVLLVSARVGLTLADDNVLDIGFAGVVGADRISRGEGIYDGDFTPLIDRGDSYGPFNYLAYVPFEGAFPWQRGTTNGLDAAKAASVFFDLLVIGGLLAAGRRLRDGPTGRDLGIVLAFAWVAYPFSTYALVSDSNDALVGALMLAALLAFASPPRGGVLVALASAAKFGPLALAPLFAAGPGDARIRRAIGFSIAFVAVWALVLVPLLPDGGLREFYDRSFGYQASRGSPFSVWGLDPSLHSVQVAARIFPVVLGLAFFVWPVRRDRPQLAALGAVLLIATQIGSTHWFYFFIAWWAPLALLALFAEHDEISQPPVSPGSWADNLPAPAAAAPAA